MTDIPIKNRDPGFIDTLIHNLTGSQILFYTFHTWKHEPNRPVTLWCRKGDAEFKVNAIRVALSKERKVRGIPRTFELRFSEPFPYTYRGIKGEAVKVERVGGTMQTRVVAAFYEMIQKGKQHGG